MEQQTLMQMEPVNSSQHCGPCRMAVWCLPAETAHTAECSARALLADALRGAGVHKGRILDAETTVAELAVNAIQHAAPPYELRIFFAGGTVPIWCEVLDGSPSVEVIAQWHQPRDDSDGGLSENGRGLLMADGLSDGRCACYPTSFFVTGLPAKAVGFALPCRREEA